MFDMKKTRKVFVVLTALLLIVGFSVWKNVYAAEYGYDSDVDSFATMASAERIVKRQGGYFVPPEAVRNHFNTDVRVPHRLPFTERQLFDCGRCILFPTVSKIGYRDVPTSINKLWRAPEAKELFNRLQSLSTPWFKKEPWARTPLADEWHLVRLAVEDKGRVLRRSDFAADEQPLRPNEAFWFLLMLPPEELVGDFFYTGTTTDGGRNAVILGIPQRGTIKIDRTPQGFQNLDVGRITKIVPRR